MPTYEYVCTECKNQWEEIQKISENPIEVCPKCGKSSAKRQISGGSFILKGGGWYADLYASSPKKGGSTSDSSSGTAPASSTKSDASGSTSSAPSAPAASSPSSDSSSK